jgi:hypothetical protein
MRATIFRSALLVTAVTLAFNATAAQRTFVSTSGSDANTTSNCSNTAPCRGFSAALTVTDSGGEIIVLSSGGYGGVTINKSVSIIAPEGIYAGISVFASSGISIATAGVDVVLRGLTINGLGGSYGVNMSAGNSLTVQNCTVRNFPSDGISVQSNTKVRILDSLLQGNSYAAYFYNGATVMVSRSRFLGNGFGLAAVSSGAGMVTRLEVSQSESSDNSAYGFYGEATGGAKTEINIKDSVASRNNHGVYAISYSSSTTITNIAGSLVSGNSSNGVLASSSGGTTLATVSGSLVSANPVYGLQAVGSGAKLVTGGNTVTHNGTGLYQTSSAILQSTGDNTLSDNTASTSGTISPLTKL